MKPAIGYHLISDVRFLGDATYALDPPFIDREVYDYRRATWKGEDALPLLRALLANRGRFVCVDVFSVRYAILAERSNIAAMVDAAAPALSAREILALRSKIACMADASRVRRRAR